MSLYIYLVTLMLTFPPAYVERDEPAAHREARLQRIAGELVSALEEVYPNDAEKQWHYGVLLAFVGNRETRFANDISRLGSQDQGAAHGYWQVHEWRGLNPYATKTAVLLMQAAPEAWCLPANQPWTGFPKAAAYLQAHPLTVTFEMRPMKGGPSLPLTAGR
jgi:hypothetical protein